MDFSWLFIFYDSRMHWGIHFPELDVCSLFRYSDIWGRLYADDKIDKTPVALVKLGFRSKTAIHSSWSIDLLSSVPHHTTQDRCQAGLDCFGGPRQSTRIDVMKQSMAGLSRGRWGRMALQICYNMPEQDAARIWFPPCPAISWYICSPVNIMCQNRTGIDQILLTLDRSCWSAHQFLKKIRWWQHRTHVGPVLNPIFTVYLL